MSVTFGFYNSLNGDRKYDAIQVSSIFDGIIRDGIFMSIGECMVVKANSGLTVNVTPGRAWFNHTWTLVDANHLVRWEKAEGEEYPVDLDGNDVTPETVADRIDAIVLRVNSEIGVRENFIGIKKGTPSTVDPQKPNMTRTDTVNEYPLAFVHVKPGAIEISQSDIENMVGTDQTPFITGLLDTVNISQLLLQWQSQWNDQYTADQLRFDTWLLTQQSALDLWMKNRQDSFDSWTANEQANFEAWFANIQDILDESVAAKLQKEIDELNKIVHFIVEYDQSLSGATITVSNEDGTETYTSIATNLGVSEFDGYSLGEWTFAESLYGSSNSVMADYHGRYFVAVGGDKFIYVTYDPEFEGKIITCTNGTDTQRRTAAGEKVKFCFMNAGTYTISATVDDKEYTASVKVDKAGDYNVSLKFIKEGFVDSWTDAAGISKTYADLDELLADEASLRILFTKHASVDFLVDNVDTFEDDIQTVIRNDYCAKWINLRDYALDTLYSNAKIKKMMDRSAVGPLVPKLSSNTGANGEASSSSYYGSDSNRPSQAFDRNLDTDFNWNGSDTVNNAYLQYKFNEQVNIKSFSLKNSTAKHVGFDIKISNDGVTWTNVGSYTKEDNVEKYYDLNDDVVCSYVRLVITDMSSTFTYPIQTLQFYGYGDAGERKGGEAKALVPTMTSDTAPSGRAFCSDRYSVGFEAYRAFDNKETTCWCNKSGAKEEIGYEFPSPVCVNKVMIKNADTTNGNNTYSVKNFSVYASNTGNDGDWTKLYSGTHASSNALYSKEYSFSNTEKYKIYEIYTESSWNTSYVTVGELQFYCSADGSSELPVNTKYFLGEWVYTEGDYEPLVPKMTGESTPSGKVTDSHHYLQNYPWYAFNQDESNAWYTNYNEAWIQYAFPTPTCVTKLYWKRKNDNAQQGSNKMNLQASNNSVDWVTLYTNNSLPKGSTSMYEESYEFENEEKYTFYRINIENTTNPGYGESNFHIIQFYGKTESTWGPKGNVPVMTSNTTPYGEIISSTATSGREAYKAFDKNTAEYFATSAGANSAYIGYRFVNPVCVKKLSYTSLYPFGKMNIQASNDGTTWTNIMAGVAPSRDTSVANVYYIDIDNDDFYLYYRLLVTEKYNTDTVTVRELQFYGRELSVSVPKMTSNTEPWGEILYSALYSTSDYLPVSAFDGSTTGHGFVSKEGIASAYIGYDFGYPVVVKMATGDCKVAAVHVVQGSNDKSTWEDLASNYAFRGAPITFANGKAYRYYRVKGVSGASWVSASGVKLVNFYGLDYSEHEERHWIYDHGVEVEEITLHGTNGSKNSDNLEVRTIAGSQNASDYMAISGLDLTSYKLMRANIDNKYIASQWGSIGINRVNAMADDTLAVDKYTHIPNGYIDISSINQVAYPYFGASGSTSAIATVKEWWLE